MSENFWLQKLDASIGQLTIEVRRLHRAIDALTNQLPPAQEAEDDSGRGDDDDREAS